MWTDGQTDMTKFIAFLAIFAKVPKSEVKI